MKKTKVKNIVMLLGTIAGILAGLSILVLFFLESSNDVGCLIGSLLRDTPIMVVLLSLVELVVFPCLIRKSISFLLCPLAIRCFIVFVNYAIHTTYVPLLMPNIQISRYLRTECSFFITFLLVIIYAIYSMIREIKEQVQIPLIIFFCLAITRIIGIEIYDIWATMKNIGFSVFRALESSNLSYVIYLISDIIFCIIIIVFLFSYRKCTDRL